MTPTPTEKATARKKAAIGPMTIACAKDVAYEACKSICPSDPLRAAEAIGEAFALIKDATKPHEYKDGLAWQERASALLSRLQGGVK